MSCLSGVKLVTCFVDYRRLRTHQHRKLRVSGFIFTDRILTYISSEPHAADFSFILTWNTLLGGLVGPDQLEIMIFPL